MEVVVSQAGRRISRVRNVSNQGRIMNRPTFKRVQVVYYLSRNGHLEHPHYMEVTHLAHQQLRLKDVMDRLTVLRGKGMPSLYSWSCKRSYKNGYVWNDLAENDVIYPSEGAEYVLKGSELIQGCTEKLHHLQVVGNVQDSNFQPERSSLASKREEMVINSQLYGENYQDHENNNNIAVPKENEETTPRSRCSRRVSTDAIRDHQEFNKMQQKRNNNNNNNNGSSHELSLDCNSFSISPPSTTSSNISDKPNNSSNNNINISKRFEDVDQEGNESIFSRNSMLLSLIACGGSASFRKIVPPPKTGGSCGDRGGNLHKGVVCKAAAAVEEEEMMIGCMSENPRFRNLQGEEKEYFSGSIVEAIKNEVNVEPGLKRSSSHNEQRSTKSGLGEEAEGEVEKDKGVTGRCIPMKKSSTKQSKK